MPFAFGGIKCKCISIVLLENSIMGRSYMYMINNVGLVMADGHFDSIHVQYNDARIYTFLYCNAFHYKQIYTP